VLALPVREPVIMLLEVRHLRALEASPSHRDRDGTGVFDQPLDGLGPVLLDRPSRWALRRRHRWGISPKRPAASGRNSNRSIRAAVSSLVPPSGPVDDAVSTWSVQFLLRVYDGRHKTLVYLVSLCVPCARYWHIHGIKMLRRTSSWSREGTTDLPTGIACFTFVAGALAADEFRAGNVPLRDPGPRLRAQLERVEQFQWIVFLSGLPYWYAEPRVCPGPNNARRDYARKTARYAM
jgi:hypothetical protein